VSFNCPSIEKYILDEVIPLKSPRECIAICYSKLPTSTHPQFTPIPIPTPTPTPTPTPISSPLQLPTQSFPPSSNSQIKYRCCWYTSPSEEKCLRLVIEKCPIINGFEVISEFITENSKTCDEFCE
jgi:hypothetical protein